MHVRSTAIDLLTFFRSQVQLLSLQILQFLPASNNSYKLIAWAIIVSLFKNSISGKLFDFIEAFYRIPFQPPVTRDESPHELQCTKCISMHCHLSKILIISGLFRPKLTIQIILPELSVSSLTHVN